MCKRKPHRRTIQPPAKNDDIGLNRFLLSNHRAHLCFLRQPGKVA
jgi:hypothetical protein